MHYGGPRRIAGGEPNRLVGHAAKRPLEAKASPIDVCRSFLVEHDYGLQIDQPGEAGYRRADPPSPDRHLERREGAVHPGLPCGGLRGRYHLLQSPSGQDGLAGGPNDQTQAHRDLPGVHHTHPAGIDCLGGDRRALKGA